MKRRRTSGRSGRTPRRPSIDVLFEDRFLLAVQKAPGLPSVPIRGSDVPSALSLAAQLLDRKKQHPYIVHRIDRFTSGVLLFAKNRSSREKLIEQFLAHEPKREYLAVVRGRLEGSRGTLVHYLRKEGFHQRLSNRSDKEAARAELSFTVREQFSDAALVEVSLATGLQNQIRVQFHAAGHPLIGDRKYRPSESEEQLIDRVALHAVRLTVEHPVTGRTLRIECPPPADFERLLSALRRAK